MRQFLLDRALSPDRRTSRLFRLLASGVARANDGLVRYRLNGRLLELPLSHDLPRNRHVFPTYSDNLRRLAMAVRRALGRLVLVDVGANVGDSWALASDPTTPGDVYLLVEGSPRWFALLERNTGADPHVTRVRALLSDQSGEADAGFVVEDGNGRVVAGSERVRFETLDEVVERHPAFREANLLKIDVEGWDERVLRGAPRLLESARPTLLFEHQPRLIAAMGGDDRTVFHALAARGYGRFMLYDNRGYLLATLAAADGDRLEELLRYARMQPDCYYDVCAIHDAHTALRDAFLSDERAFYSALEHRP